MIIMDGQELAKNNQNNIKDNREIIENMKENKNIKIKYAKQFLMKLIELGCGLIFNFFFFFLIELYLIYSKYDVVIEKNKILIIVANIYIIYYIIIFILKSLKYLFKYDENYEYFNNFIKVFELLFFKNRKRRTKIDKVITIIFLFTMIIYYTIKSILN